MGALGKNIPHDSARGHVSGESIFIDDIPPVRGEVFIDFLGSPVAHGRIRSVDLTAARNVPGIVALFTHRDITGCNRFGPIIPDEHLMVEETADFLGDPIVLIAAESRAAIAEAKKLIKLEVDVLRPIFTIDEAIASKQFIGPLRTIARGEVEAALRSSEHVLEGAFEVGGQEHFYLESQAAIAYPGEHGTMTVHSSTQHPTEAQSVVAEVLGVPFNHVTVICKRMGGGFGGKETQGAQPAAMAALVAHLLKRPARVVHNKDDDMRFTGKRHPFKSWYKVGFDNDGNITALAIDHYSNGGCSTDLSLPVMERAMLHTDNAYFIPNIRITGAVCRTNLPSNTAFRGFGGPQGVASIENILETIAQHLSADALEVRRRNVYGIDDRNTTPYGQVVRNNTLPHVFEQLQVTSSYDERRRQIARFNSISKTHLRGLSMTAVKFGISFTKKSMNQANALVNIYTDGSVMVSSGGTEMGQGIGTRIRQIVADELGVSYDLVIVAPTSTDRNHNTSPTAASASTDLNGAAAVDACARLKQRLREFVATQIFHSPADAIQFADGFVFDSMHRISFKEAVEKAYLERVNLGERGFYATPGVDFDRETGQGTPFLYYTNGAAVAQVLIDRFTGEMKVERVDLLMDAGIPINPGIDRGQITGGFVQGMGWVTTEELRYAESGELLTHSPTTYKIPSIGDVPDVFNVDLLDNPDNAVSLYRSKAVGEPPLLLGICVFTAAKNALSYLDPKAANLLTVPATGEKLLMCITQALARRSDRVPATQSAANPIVQPRT